MEKLKVQSDTPPFTMIKNAIIDSVDILNEHEKILYIVLLRYGNKAFPSLSTLSHKCGFSKRTAQRTIDTLTEKGLLRKRSRVSKKNGNTSNVYTLIDNDKIWLSTKENLQENVKTAILEEAIKIVEASGRKVFDKEKGLVSDSDQTADTSTSYKSIGNDSTNIKKNQEKILEKYPLAYLKKALYYNDMLLQSPYDKDMIDTFFHYLYETMNTTKPTIRVNGEEKPREVIISVLSKLEYFDFLYAVEKYKENTSKVNNQRAYIITLLYNAKSQSHADITNQVQHNMYG